LDRAETGHDTGVHDSEHGRGAVSTFLVEICRPRPGAQRVSDAAARARRATAALREEGAAVRYRQSILVPGEETWFCLFDADSLDAVAAVLERAALVSTQIIEAATGSHAPHAAVA
jgi:hypothetical protein